MALSTIHPNAYYFDIPDYGLEGVIDCYEDPDGIFVRLSSRKTGEVNWTFNYQAPIYDYNTKEQCDAGLANCISEINGYLARTMPKKDTSPAPESGLGYVASRVREGLFFNADTHQIEIK